MSRKKNEGTAMPVYDLQDMHFEWDDDKNRKNREKHGISFETAMHVFEDKDCIENYDQAHSQFENRYQVIGMVRQILLVVYTERNERIRIISARKANQQERRLYQL